MKNFKISVGLVVIILAITTAFTTNYFSPVTFVFDGSVSDGLQRVNPFYYHQETSAITCPLGANAFCKIIADPTTMNPNTAKPIIGVTSDLYNSLYNDNEDLPAELSNEVFLKN